MIWYLHVFTYQNNIQHIYNETCTHINDPPSQSPGMTPGMTTRLEVSTLAKEVDRCEVLPWLMVGFFGGGKSLVSDICKESMAWQTTDYLNFSLLIDCFFLSSFVLYNVKVLRVGLQVRIITRYHNRLAVQWLVGGLGWWCFGFRTIPLMKGIVTYKYHSSTSRIPNHRAPNSKNLQHSWYTVPSCWWFRNPAPVEFGSYFISSMSRGFSTIPCSDRHLLHPPKTVFILATTTPLSQKTMDRWSPPVVMISLLVCRVGFCGSSQSLTWFTWRMAPLNRNRKPSFLGSMLNLGPWLVP